MSLVINIKNEANGLECIGSRAPGEIIREKIKKEIDAGGKVTLDFGGVELITQSFADEMIGILVRAFGIEYIRKKLLLVNENEDIRNTLNFVIFYSKDRRVVA